MNRTGPVIVLALGWIISNFFVRLRLESSISQNPSGFRYIGRLLARILWQQSEVFRDTGRWYMVLPLLKITNFLDPNFAEAYDFAGWHIAYNLRAEEKDERRRIQWVKLGMQVYEQGLKRNPNDFTLLFGMGWTAYDKLGDTVFAAYYLEKSLNASGKFTKDIDWARHMLAHSYERMPNIRLALQHWKEAMTLTPNNPVAQGATITLEERYALAEAMAERGYYEEAIESVEHLVRRPDMKFSTIPRHMLAYIYLEMGDIDSAIAILEEMRYWHAMEHRAEFKADQLRKLKELRKLKPAE